MKEKKSKKIPKCSPDVKVFESPGEAKKELGAEEVQTTTNALTPISFKEPPEPVVITGVFDTKLASEKMSRIALTMAKQYGEKAMMYLRDHPDYAKVHNWVSTQNCAVDWILSGKADGTGGLPVGRIIELFGDPASGKSLLLTQILAEVQRRGGIPVLYDPETTFDSYFATRVGLNTNEIMYSKCYKEVKRQKMVLDKEGKLVKEMITVQLPATVEQLRDEIEELIDITYHEFPGVLLVIGLDSVAALSTKHELQIAQAKEEKDRDKRDFTKASGIRTFVKMLEAKMADKNCIFIATNHVIANIKIENPWERSAKPARGLGPKEDKSAPGGSGLPFGSSVRLDLTRGNDIRDKANKTLVEGHEIHVFSHKNKVYPAHKFTTVEMNFATGMDRYSGLLDILIAKDVVDELGDQVFRYKGTRFKRKTQDKPRFLGLSEVIEKHPEIPSLINEI
jgi:recombination protein RecA